MIGRKTKPQTGPTLLDRIVTSQCRRIAILGLHPAAGARTVLAALVRELHKRAWPFGVSAVPGLALEAVGGSETAAIVPMALPDGAVIASADSTLIEREDDVEVIEPTPWTSALGPVVIARTLRAGEFGLHGPAEAEAMRNVVGRLADRSGGIVLVEGGWERRAFAAPDSCDGLILVLGAGYSATPARAAAAARYIVETLTVPPCEEPARVAWHETASAGAAAMLDGNGRPAGILPPGLEDPVPALKAKDGRPIDTVVLPHGLNDEFLIPLVRSKHSCTLVVRDPTRLNVAPIYFKAFLKGRGRIQSVLPARIVAVATNPFNAGGPDADPEEFRQTVASALPELHVHDVVLESEDEARKPLWKFWD